MNTNRDNFKNLKQELLPKPNIIDINTPIKNAKKRPHVPKPILDQNQDRQLQQSQQLSLMETIEFIEAEDLKELQRREDEMDTKELLRKSRQIAEITQDIHELIESQGDTINDADAAVDESADISKNAVVEIGRAKKSFFRSRLIKGSLIGAVLGLCLGGPAGSAIGYSAGAGALGSGIVGGIAGLGVGFGGSYGILQSKVKE